MKASFEASGLLSSNIGLFSRTEKDGSVSCGPGRARDACQRKSSRKETARDETMD